MAGRGTDILLGGNPAMMARLRVREALAAAAGTAVPEVAATFYPAKLSAEVLSQLDAAGSTLREELAARPDSEGGPLISIEARDGMLQPHAAEAAAPVFAIQPVALCVPGARRDVGRRRLCSRRVRGLCQ